MVAVAVGGAGVLSAVSSSIAGNKAAKAIEKGAESAAASADRAADVQQYMYDTTRGDFAPYRQVGQGALYKLSDMYGVGRPKGDRQYAAPQNGQPGASGTTLAGQFGLGSFDLGSFGLGQNATGATPQTPIEMTPGYDGFQASPGYQFRLSEGVKAAERSASARGLLGSGGTIKAIQRYGEGLASSEYENYANRLAALAGVGQSSTGSTAAAGAQAASGIGNALNQGGQAAIAAGNARASAYANTGAAVNKGITNLASAYLYSQNPLPAYDPRYPV